MLLMKTEGQQRARDFQLCAVALVALFLTGCASNNAYMGISLVSGQADPELQELASRARHGDKHAQLELGIRFEGGRGVPVDRTKAGTLYRLAATDTGGHRTMYAPAKAGMRPILVTGGPAVRGLTEAKSKLVTFWRGPARQRRDYGVREGYFPASESKFESEEHSHWNDQSKVSENFSFGSGPLGEITTYLVKIELFSDRCLVRTRADPVADLDKYAELGWTCIIQSQLPDDCRRYSDRLIDVVRVVRFHENFAFLRKSMPRMIKACVLQENGRLYEGEWPKKRAATFLDIDLDDLAQSSPDQQRLVYDFRKADEAHQTGPILPGYSFATSMCRGLSKGELFSGSKFWLVYCRGPEFAERQKAASATIDELMQGWKR